MRKYLGLKTNKILIVLQYKFPSKSQKLTLYFNTKLFGTGYAWIFAHKNFTAIGCCSNVRFRNISQLNKNFQIWLELNKINIGRQKLQGSIINFDYQGYEFDNIFLVGDAAGLVSGLTGEGIYFAMVSGNEIASRIINPKYETLELKKFSK